MTRVVVTGAGGMLGQALMGCVPEGVQAIAVTRAEGDLTSPDGVRHAVAEPRPKVVIHAAAWTDVDGCERDPARAWSNNTLATRLVCETCQALGARLVGLSTDYVFDGLSGTPYCEGAPVNPTSVYGETKLAAERAIAALEDSVIVRTQWLYGPGGRNFVAAVLRQAWGGQPVSVVADQTGCPTYTKHLAPAVWRLAMSAFRGVVHVAGQGLATWLDLARVAFEAARVHRAPIPIAAEDWPSPVRRPRFSALAQDRWIGWAGSALPSWREGVKQYVHELLLEGGFQR
ncbi:MAG: dTDP-4-dehydrorhamnose reductase [Armatimonadota bacterium]